MVFAQVPCICFNTIAYNCPGTFFKQLGQEESDIRVPPEIKPNLASKLSRHKDKDWREHNSFYSQMNLAWEKRDNRLVYQRHNEESEMNFGFHSRSISGRGGVEAITNDPVDNQDESDEIPFPISVENFTGASNNDQNRWVLGLIRNTLLAEDQSISCRVEASNSDQMNSGSYFQSISGKGRVEASTKDPVFVVFKVLSFYLQSLAVGTPSPSWILSPAWRAQALGDTPEVSSVETEDDFCATTSFGSNSNSFPTGFSFPENVIPDTYGREAENKEEVTNYLDAILEELILEMTEHSLDVVLEAKQDICRIYGFDPQSSPMHIVSQGESLIRMVFLSHNN
ncbi:hypothetical protein AT2G05350 [Arabidopsis thaliana]|nr:uncharacterized protein AT2G05350 [Arabidopsis thaliana]NP_001323645.1 uncharacterized protein AT2G05350 [Arabidopsis thaliana]ANM61427.1 hypothetical protein AT2G05350 [Arabidopsis thaliana]ANM61428.1 hypothetical protein AT2G05350 [Arabidopsis thaliana]|eukprot:NP_001323644.1 hypothetical protein AT2G05350 [Arabidopsis thaliana]